MSAAKQSTIPPDSLSCKRSLQLELSCRLWSAATRRRFLSQATLNIGSRSTTYKATACPPDRASTAIGLAAIGSPELKVASHPTRLDRHHGSAMPRITSLLFVGLTCVVICPGHAAVIRRVVGPADAVPGVPGATFETADSPEFDSQGNIRFLGRIGGPQITWTNSQGFWRQNAADGQVELLTRITSPLPGGADGETIKSWAAWGNGLALVNLTGPTVDADRDLALIDLRSATASTLVREGQPVPGMKSGARFESMIELGQSDSTESNVVFAAQLVGPDITVENDSGLWVHSSKGFRQVVREGDLPPGLSSPFYEFTAKNVDSLGRAAFVGHFYGADPKSRLNDNGLYAERNGRIEELLRTSAQAPGLASGIAIDYIGYPRMNSGGQITVHAELSGAGVNTDNDQAVYVERGNGVELLLRKGEPVAGLPDLIWDGSEGYFGTRADALVSVRAATNEEWQLLATGWRQVTPPPQHGDPAPGTAAEFSYVWWTRANARGQRVYIAELANDDDNPNNDAGIWAEDETGALQLVVREGDTIETKPGLFETISFDSLHSELRGFNDRGEILFTSQGGVYVATLNPVPEPSSVVLSIFSAALVAFFAVRRRGLTR